MHAQIYCYKSAYKYYYIIKKKSNKIRYAKNTVNDKSSEKRYKICGGANSLRRRNRFIFFVMDW